MLDNNEVLSNPDTFHATLQKLGAEPSAPEPKPIENEPEHEEIAEDSSTSTTEEPEPSEELVDPVEPTESSASDSEDDYKSRKFIPKSRFDQEIKKKNELQNEWMKEREEKIRLEEQLKMFTHLQQQQTASYEAPELDLDKVDPLDSETHSVYSREIKKLKEELRNTTHQTRQMQYSSIVSSQEVHFQKDNPDYMDAANYLRNVEFEGAKAMYGDDKAAEQVVRQKYQQVMSKSLESGRNVPDTIYNLAKAYGYKPESKSAKADEVKGGSNLKAINSNMKKSASISGLGNSVGLSGMSPKDFSSTLKDPSNPRSGVDPKKFQAALRKAS